MLGKFRNAIAIPVLCQLLLLLLTACAGTEFNSIQVSFGPSGAVIGATGTFTCLSPIAEDVVVYRWTFGDGATAEGRTVTHSYQAAGDYLVECTALTRTTFLAFSRVLSIRPPYLYLINNGTTEILRGTPDGAMPLTTLFDSGDGLSDLYYVVVNNGYLYLTDCDTDLIYRGNADGSGSLSVLYDYSSLSASTGECSNGLFIDGDTLYWNDYDDAEVYRAPLDGSGAPTLLYDAGDGLPTSDIEGIFVDENWIYIAGVDQSEVYRAPKDGSGPVDVLYDSGDGLSEVNAVWVIGSDLYIADGDTSEILRGDADGSSLTLDVIWDAGDGLSAPAQIFIDGSTIYITDENNDEVYSGSIDGSGTLTLIYDSSDGIDEPWGIWIY